MILAGVKYAWSFLLARFHVLMRSSASCIRGHRTSSCKHTDRSLFETGKKGRPISQCAHCRDLRQVKSLHTSCKCGTVDKLVDVNPNHCGCHLGASCTCAAKLSGSKLRRQREASTAESPAAQSNAVLETLNHDHPEAIARDDAWTERTNNATLNQNFSVDDTELVSTITVPSHTSNCCTGALDHNGDLPPDISNENLQSSELETIDSWAQGDALPYVGPDPAWNADQLYYPPAVMFSSIHGFL